MSEINYKGLTDAELIDLFRDAGQPDEVRDAAYKEANARREKTISKRHTEDDEPETM